MLLRKERTEATVKIQENFSNSFLHVHIFCQSIPLDVLKKKPTKDKDDNHTYHWNTNKENQRSSVQVRIRTNITNRWFEMHQNKVVIK